MFQWWWWSWIEKRNLLYVIFLFYPRSSMYLLFRGSLLHFVPFVFLLDSYLFLPFPSSYCYSYFDLKIFSCIYIISTLTFCKKLLNKISWRDNGKSAKKKYVYTLYGGLSRGYFSHIRKCFFSYLSISLSFSSFLPIACYCCCCLTFLLTIFHSMFY